MKPDTRAFAAAALGLFLSSVAWADILVSSSGNDSVLRYSDKAGAFIGALVPSGVGGLDDPRGLAVGPGNLLYVASRGTSRVIRYDAGTGSAIDSFVHASLTSITDLAIGPDGNLYVLSGGFAGEVLRFDTGTRALIDSFVVAVPVLNTPIYMDFADAEFAVGTDTSRLFRFDALTGVQLSSQIRDTLQGVDYGPDGNLYIGASDSANVIRRDALTGTLSDFVAPNDAPGVRDIAFGPDSNLYVLANNGVARYDGSSGDFIDTFIASGSGGLTEARYFVFVQGVPEPGAVALVLAALLALVMVRLPLSRDKAL